MAYKMSVARAALIMDIVHAYRGGADSPARPFEGVFLANRLGLTVKHAQRQLALAETTYNNYLTSLDEDGKNREHAGKTKQ